MQLDNFSFFVANFRTAIEAPYGQLRKQNNKKNPRQIVKYFFNNERKLPLLPEDLI